MSISSDDYLSLKQVSALLPGRPNLSTLHRWRLRGIRGLRLETTLIGGRRFVAREALRDFVTRLSSPSAPSAESQLSRDEAISAAERFLLD
jgi:hypothetical protein